MKHLTEPQEDVIVELGNIGISRAARQLSAMLDEPIRIAVPRVELTTAGAAAKYLNAGATELACIYQGLSGELSGRAALLLPSRDSHLLFRSLLGAYAPLQGLDLRAFELEAMTEIGNIIISSCVSAMADMLGIRIQVSVPRYAEAAPETLFSDEGLDHSRLPALVIHAHLTATQRQLDGVILLILSNAAAERILRAVEAIVRAADQGEGLA